MQIMIGFIPFSLVLPLLSADLFASIADTLFRGEQVKCFVAREFRTAAGGRVLLITPDCSLGLIECGLFETVMDFFFALLRMCPEGTTS